MGNALFGWKGMILGSALWLLAVLTQVWIPISITLAMATLGTALWILPISQLFYALARKIDLEVEKMIMAITSLGICALIAWMVLLLRE
jgi:hypothetical protein